MRLLCLLALLAGCTLADNSGGDPPAGQSVPFEVLTPPDRFWCQAFFDDAALVDDEAAIDALLDSCETPPEGEARALIRDAFIAALGGGAAGDVLVYAEGSAGGCVGRAWIEDVLLDGAVLRPWMLKEDSSYGRMDVACTADFGLTTHLLRVSDAGSATSAELTLGVFNPELPGAPQEGGV